MEKKNANDFRFGKVIGEGSFSTVYLAKEITSGKEYASKMTSEPLSWSMTHKIFEFQSKFVTNRRSSRKTNKSISRGRKALCTFSTAHPELFR